jgi:hypothetical protein
MTVYSFSDLHLFTDKVMNRAELVVKESAQRVASEVRQRTRVDTGFLRASFLASTSAMPLIDRDARPATGALYTDNDTEIALVIAGASLGQTIYLGFTASYAVPREYQDGMVRLAAQRWTAIVGEVVAEAKARFP